MNKTDPEFCIQKIQKEKGDQGDKGDEGIRRGISTSGISPYLLILCETSARSAALKFEKFCPLVD